MAPPDNWSIGDYDAEQIFELAQRDHPELVGLFTELGYEHPVQSIRDDPNDHTLVGVPFETFPKSGKAHLAQLRSLSEGAVTALNGDGPLDRIYARREIAHFQDIVRRTARRSGFDQHMEKCIGAVMRAVEETAKENDGILVFLRDRSAEIRQEAEFTIAEDSGDEDSARVMLDFLLGFPDEDDEFRVRAA